MQQLHTLQQFSKAKRKYPNPQYFLQILHSIEKEDTKINITLTIKGIIMELITSICLNQYRLFSKIVFDFYQSLHSGRFISGEKSTVKKRRNGTPYRGNTTTVKKKKQGELPEIARNAADLDEMLEKELSSPKNIQIRSQTTSNLSLPKQDILQFPQIKNIDMPTWNSHQYLTPLKPLSQQSNQQLFNQYRKLITIPPQKRSLSTTNKKLVTKTRKKISHTQQLPQQINTFISLQFSSQISLKKQIQNIIDLTKKKKIKQKQDVLSHQIFYLEEYDISIIFNNKQNIIIFNQEYYQPNRQHKLDTDISSQKTNRFNLLQDIFSNSNINNQSQPILLTTPQENLKKFNQYIAKNDNKISFNTFIKNHQLNVKEKAYIFYSLLCDQKYKLQQPLIQQFGDITITVNKNKIF